MPTRLIFGRPRHAGGLVHLVFGAGLVQVVPDPVQVIADLQLGDLVVMGAVQYDNRLPLRASTSAAAPHQVARPAAAEPALWHGLARRAERAAMPGWQLAAPEAAVPRAPWGRSAAAAAEPALLWSLAVQSGASVGLVHQAAAVRRQQALAAWQAGAQVSGSWALAHEAAALLRLRAVAPWALGQPVAAVAVGRYGPGVMLRAVRAAPWQVARPAPPGLDEFLTGGEAPPPRETSTHLVFACPPWAGGALHLVFGHVCNAVPALVAIPVRTYYMTFNSIALRRVVGNIALDAHAFSMTLDADSWTWRWNATLDRSAEAALQPDVAGQPVELEAVVNGVPYRLLVGRVGQSTQFPRTRFTVSGEGLAGVLADPHAPVATYSSAVDLTAQQLMEQVLTVNGQSIGWGLDWGLTDWLVPGNAWTFQGTPIEALVDIAGAAGGYLQPHATAQTLRVLPRYPTAPWEWASVVPDVQLPGSAVEVQSMDWVDRPGYNGVFVGGIGAGVFGPVTRAGTAGDVLAPQVTHQLITDADAHRQRGLAVLADTGRQVHMSLALQVLPETGLILPGQMVRYVAGQTRVGIVRSVALDWSSPVMRQTIGVESHAA